MKTLNEYLNLSYRMEIVEDRDEGGFVVSFPDIPGCITCGETVEAAVENAKDASPHESGLYFVPFPAFIHNGLFQPLGRLPQTPPHQLLKFPRCQL